MMIDLENKVIIVDEAHNIEDNARDAASLTINSDELTEVTNEIQEICKLVLLCMVASWREIPVSPTCELYKEFGFFLLYKKCV